MEISEFVGIVEKYPYDIEVSVGGNRVNAKSISGMLALGLNRVMNMEIVADTADDVINDISKFVCNKFGQVLSNS